jgi:DNA-binding MarR family transcriptional regulator
MLVLWWINLHPYHGAHEIARDMGADVQEIERLCRDLEAVGFIEPLTVH